MWTICNKMYRNSRRFRGTVMYVLWDVMYRELCSRRYREVISITYRYTRCKKISWYYEAWTMKNMYREVYSRIYHTKCIKRLRQIYTNMHRDIKKIFYISIVKFIRINYQKDIEQNTGIVNYITITYQRDIEQNTGIVKFILRCIEIQTDFVIRDLLQFDASTTVLLMMSW